MIRGYEIVLGILMTLAFLFPLRPLLFRHFRTLIGALVGLVVGRIAYVYLSWFFGFENEIVKLICILISASLFSEATRDLLDKIFPKNMDRPNG
jgi:hypothetical protein